MKCLKLAIACCSLFMLFGAYADTYTDGAGITWTYTVQNGLATISAAEGATGQVTVPAEVNGVPVAKMGNQVFWKNTELTKVTLPESVTQIADGSGNNHGTFCDCTELTEAVLPGVTRLGRNAFSGCTKLTRVSIPNVTYIDYKAFYNCTALPTIEWNSNEITFIGGWCFQLCTSLTGDLSFAKLTTVQNAIFSSCKKITSVSMPSCNPGSASYVFSDCTALTNVVLSPSTTTLGASIFQDSPNIQHLEPSLMQIENLGQSAFQKSSSTFLQEVNMPKLTTLNQMAFRWIDCTRAYLPLVTSIPNYTFHPNATLTNCVFYRARSITQAAFSGAPLKFIKLPYTVTTVSGSPFSGCKDLTFALHTTSALDESTVTASVTNPTVVRYGGAETDAATKITWLYDDTNDDGSAMSPGKIKILAATNQVENVIVGGNLDIPAKVNAKSITGIECAAFYGNEALTSVKLSSKVISVGYAAFEKCTNLEEIKISATAPQALKDSLRAEYGDEMITEYQGDGLLVIVY